MWGSMTKTQQYFPILTAPNVPRQAIPNTVTVVEAEFNTAILEFWLPGKNKAVEHTCKITNDKLLTHKSVKLA